MVILNLRRSTAVSDAWGMWKHPKSEWPDHFNLICLGKSHCGEGTLWKLQGSLEDLHWSLLEASDGLLPQEHLTLEDKISTHFADSPQPLSLSEIAAEVDTSEEYARRICTEMFDQGILRRDKVLTGKKGRPSYLYGLS